MLTSRDIIKSHLINNVKDLITNLGVSHKEIIKDIHNAVIKLCIELPKTQVLYNSVHGGYGLSNAFFRFIANHEPKLIEAETDSNKYRIEAVKHIIPFGLEIINKYPFLNQLLIIYHHYNLNSVFNNISSICYLEKTLQSFSEKKAKLEKILSTPTLQGSKTVVDDMGDSDDNDDDDVVVYNYENNTVSLYDIVHSKHVELEGYSKETYEQAIKCINMKIDETKNYINTYKSQCLEYNITEDMFNGIKCTVCNIRKEESYTIDQCEKSFIDALFKYGIYDHKVWKCQSRYNHLALQYLLIKSKDCIPQKTKSNHVYDFALSNTYIKINNEDYNTIIKEFALVCASSRYCSLKIGEVPQYISWYIATYDGKETICFE